MRPLAPPIEVIESRLFGPSDELLMRWVEGDPSIPQDIVRALESGPEAQERRRHMEELERMMDQQDMVSEALISPAQVPAMPARLQDLFERRIASRQAHFSPKPRPGQILRIDEIRGPLGPLGWDLPEPLAVLIDQPDPQDPSGQVWSGWVVASETDYASYWDMVLEPEDEPFDPTLAGLVQVWNPVYVYVPSTSIVLAELRPERLAAVRALALEFLTPEEEPGLEGTRPGWVARRRTLHGHRVLTGTPLGGKADPRDRYRELYFAAANALKEPARLAVAELAGQYSWAERVAEALRGAFEAAGFALRPGATSAEFVVQAAGLGPALFRAATAPSGDLLRLEIEPVAGEDRLRLKAVALTGAPLEVTLETEGETQRVRLNAGHAEGQWLLQPDRSYSLRLLDPTGTELARVPLRPAPLEQMLSPNVQLLFRFIGAANPVFFLGQLPGASAPLRLLGWMRQLKGLGQDPQKRLLIHGDPLALRSALPAAGESLALEVRLPRHVFPVHEATTGEGFVIPLDIAPSDTWQVSDAFGTFGLKRDPTGALLDLLARVEQAWKRVLGRVLPARWLRAFSLRLICPVHIDLFEGESLQLPLLVAMLRALGSGMAGDGREVVPFGEGPVFASATV